MKASVLVLVATAVTLTSNVSARDIHSGGHEQVSDQVIAERRQNLAKNTEDKGFGPQSPRDIDSGVGSNGIVFAPAFPLFSSISYLFHG